MTRGQVFDRAKDWFDSPGVTRVMKVIALLSLVAALFSVVQQNRLTSCLASWNDANNRISAARAAANDGDRRALDDMIESVATATAKTDVDRAFLAYIKARAYADGQRAANPLPEPPSVTC